MTRVALCGARGRLGRLIVAEAGERFAGAVERTGPVPDCDVVIDVSSAEGLAALLPRLSGQPLVVGTTGDLPWAALEAYAQRAPVAGVLLMVTFVSFAMRETPCAPRRAGRPT